MKSDVCVYMCVPCCKHEPSHDSGQPGCKSPQGVSAHIKTNKSTLTVNFCMANKGVSVLNTHKRDDANTAFSNTTRQTCVPKITIMLFFIRVLLSTGIGGEGGGREGKAQTKPTHLFIYDKQRS